MKFNDIESNSELKNILWACYKYCKTESELNRDKSICYHWIIKTYEERFNISFHQSKLNHLVKLDFLSKDESSRGGNRRYYKINNPKHLEARLIEWKLL